MAMERGTVDAAILSLISLKPYSLEELVNAISTNANFGTFPTILAMDSDAYGRLPPEEQKIISECGLKVEEELAEYFDAKVDTLMEEFSELGIEMYEFSGEARLALNQRLEAVSQELITRLVNRGLPAQKAYDDYRAALASHRENH